MARHTYFAITTAVLVLSLCLSGIFYGLGTTNFKAVYAQTATSNDAYGLLGSIQNNQHGNRTWVITGVWVMRLGNVSSTENITASSHVSDFHANFTMVMLNGTASHSHQISNFTQTGRPTINRTLNSTTIHGNVTVTMREGPVHNVPTRITIYQGKAIAIWLDPSKTSHHFGDTRIWGTVGIPKAISDEIAMLTSNATMMGGSQSMTMQPQGQAGTSGQSQMTSPSYQG